MKSIFPPPPFTAMGFLIFLVMISKYSLLRNLQDHFSFLKQLFVVFFSRLFGVYKQNSDSHDLEEYDHIAPSLVSLPVDILTTKEELSVDAYSCPWERTSMNNNNNNNNEEEEEEEEEDDPSCAVCLEKFREASSDDKVRQLHNCRHVFHKECLGAWVQRGHVTCPVCRAKLLADQTRREEEEEWPKSGEGSGDPWRLERMMYLFGDDVLF